MLPSSGPRHLVADKGFTLIETLVAISILAISLVVILQLFSGGLKSGKLSDEYTRAIFHAREKMDELLLAEEITQGVVEGEFDDGFRWKTEIVLIEPEEDVEGKLPFDAFNIKVDVFWGTGGHERHFEITTMKIGEKSESDEK